MSAAAVAVVVDADCWCYVVDAEGGAAIAVVLAGGKPVVVVGLVVGLSYVEAVVAGVVGASNDVVAAAAAVVDKFGMYVVLLGLVVGIGRDAVGVAGQEIGAADSSFDLNLPGWHDLLERWE